MIIAKMTLPLALANSSPTEVGSFSIKQIVALCGDGRLADESLCSNQLREYFQIATPENLKKYLQTCLQEKFDGNGFVLQDIVNELGRRLEYTMENGRYRGTRKSDAIGFDGLWHDTGNDHHIVVEVKTTDTYSLNLDDYSRYREKLIKAGKITDQSSILLVVGREDTGGLEASVLGSGYARMVRIVSAEALANLVILKVQSDERSDINTVGKIHDLLIPFELVKLDKIIEIAFRAAEDAKATVKEEQGEEPDSPSGVEHAVMKKQDRTPPEVIAKFRSTMIESFARDRATLVKKSQALYWSADRKLRAVFAFSKQYEEKKGGHSYWYAYHSGWDQFLGEGAEGFYVLGCIGRNEAYALPYEWIHSRMNNLDATETEDRTYRHVFLYSNNTGGLALWLKGGKLDPINEFKIPSFQGIGAKS
ncbi:MAG: hypothetical protein ABSA48_07970 [Terracidiphilus sp.]|jgi:hypothetical protein